MATQQRQIILLVIDCHKILLLQKEDLLGTSYTAPVVFKYKESSDSEVQKVWFLKLKPSNELIITQYDLDDKGFNKSTTFSTLP